MGGVFPKQSAGLHTQSSLFVTSDVCLLLLPRGRYPEMRSPLDVRSPLAARTPPPEGPICLCSLTQPRGCWRTQRRRRGSQRRKYVHWNFKQFTEPPLRRRRKVDAPSGC